MSNTKHTAGPWIAKPVYGWGDKPCIVAAGKSRPLAQTIMPQEYYTDYPKRTDSKTGEVFTICSTAAAIEAGNYIATDEICASLEAENDANAKLIAAAPELLEGGSAQTEIIESAQRILTLHLLPDGIGETECISQLLELLDGHRQRDAKAKWDSAFSKATN